MGLLKGVPEEQHPARIPVPTQWEVGIVTSDEGEPWVAIEFRTPSGEQTILMRPPDADRFGIAISKNAMEAKAKGIVIAGPDDVRAIENGNRAHRRHPEIP